MNPDPSSESSISSELANRRRAGRRALQSELTLKVKSEFITGVSDNFSHIGVLFFSKEPLRVEVEVEEDGETRTYSGRLVRVQRMSAENTGFAVEFDRD